MKRASTFLSEDGVAFTDKASCLRHESKQAFIKEYDERQDGQLWAGENVVAGVDLVEFLEVNSDAIRKILKPHVPTPRPKKTDAPDAGANAGE